MEITDKIEENLNRRVDEFDMLIANIGQIRDEIGAGCIIIEASLTVGVSCSVLYRGNIILAGVSALVSYGISRLLDNRLHHVIKQLEQIMNMLKQLQVCIDPTKTIKQLPEDLMVDIVQFKKEAKPLPCYNYLDFHVYKHSATVFVARAQCSKLIKTLKEEKEDLNHLNVSELMLYLDHLYDYLGLIGNEFGRPIN